MKRRLAALGRAGGKGDRLSIKGEKRERTHGSRQQCGDCRGEGWGEVEDIGKINGDGKQLN